MQKSDPHELFLGGMFDSAAGKSLRVCEEKVSREISQFRGELPFLCGSSLLFAGPFREFLRKSCLESERERERRKERTVRRSTYREHPRKNWEIPEKGKVGQIGMDEPKSGEPPPRLQTPRVYRPLLLVSGHVRACPSSRQLPSDKQGQVAKPNPVLLSLSLSIYVSFFLCMNQKCPNQGHCHDKPNYKGYCQIR